MKTTWSALAGLACVLWLFAPVAGAGAAEEDFASLMTRGRAALAARNFEAAQAALEQAVVLRPEDPEARYALGQAYGGQRKYQPAIEQLEETLALSPGHAGALIDLAAIDADSGRLDRAAERYGQVLAEGPDPRAQRGLAGVRAKQGRADESIGMLRRLVEQDPDDIESRYQLGLILMQEGLHEEAAEELGLVTRAVPDHRGALYNLGNCLNRLGRREEAEAVLGRFKATAQAADAQVDGERRGYFQMLEADRLIQEGDYRGARDAIEEAARLSPDDPKVQGMLGQIRYATGDDAGALEAFLHADELNPNDPIVAFEIGRLYGKAGRMQQAVVWLEKSARLDPLMAEPHRLLVVAYSALGRHADASKAKEAYRRLSGESDGPR